MWFKKLPTKKQGMWSFSVFNQTLYDQISNWRSLPKKKKKAKTFPGGIPHVSIPKSDSLDFMLPHVLALQCEKDVPMSD